MVLCNKKNMVRCCFLCLSVFLVSVFGSVCVCFGVVCLCSVCVFIRDFFVFSLFLVCCLRCFHFVLIFVCVV